MSGNTYALIFIIAFTLFADSADVTIAAGQAQQVFLVVVVVFAASLQQLFSFRPEYKRLQMEKSMLQETTMIANN
jgi:hypothetical protein